MKEMIHSENGEEKRSKFGIPAVNYVAHKKETNIQCFENSAVLIALMQPMKPTLNHTRNIFLS